MARVENWYYILMKVLPPYHKHNIRARPKQRQGEIKLALWSERLRLRNIKLTSRNKSRPEYTDKQVYATWLFLPYWLPFVVSENIERLGHKEARRIFVKYFLLNLIPFTLLAYGFTYSVLQLCIVSVLSFWGINFVLLSLYRRLYVTTSVQQRGTVTRFLGVLALGVVFGVLELIALAIVESIIVTFVKHV